MKCPECNGDSRVIESRSDNIVTYRRYKCKDCQHLFYTREVINNEAKHEISKLVNIYKNKNKNK